MSYGRRTKQVKGYVDFPVNSKEYISSGEGGMFVQLIVLPSSHSDHVCCGGASTSIVMTESFIGDDLSRSPAREYYYFPNSECEHQKRFYLEWHQSDVDKSKPLPLLPAACNCYTLDKFSEKNLLSIPLLAAIDLGSTGWSGFSGRKKQYWRAKYGDLTLLGKELYQNLKRLYPRSQLRLLTWLDT